MNQETKKDIVKKIKVLKCPGCTVEVDITNEDEKNWHSANCL